MLRRRSNKCLAIPGRVETLCMAERMPCFMTAMAGLCMAGETTGAFCALLPQQQSGTIVSTMASNCRLVQTLITVTSNVPCLDVQCPLSSMLARQDLCTAAMIMCAGLGERMRSARSSARLPACALTPRHMQAQSTVGSFTSCQTCVSVSALAFKNSPLHQVYAFSIMFTVVWPVNVMK